jgi:hypothetical protein
MTELGTPIYFPSHLFDTLKECVTAVQLFHFGLVSDVILVQTMDNVFDLLESPCCLRVFFKASSPVPEFLVDSLYRYAVSQDLICPFIFLVSEVSISVPWEPPITISRGSHIGHYMKRLYRRLVRLLSLFISRDVSKDIILDYSKTILFV